MTIECTGRNVEISPKLRALAEERTERLERHLGGPASVRVILSHEKHRFRGEVIATHRRRRWTANEETSDARSALVQAFAKIDSQAGKDSEKRHDLKRKHRGAASGRPARTAGGNGGGEEIPPARERQSERGRIVRTGRRASAAKPMTIEEAAMRIDGSADDFVVFRDSSSEKVSVLYKRRDGDLGLIVPEC